MSYTVDSGACESSCSAKVSSRASLLAGQELTRRSLRQHLRRAEGRVRPPVITVMGHVVSITLVVLV